MPRRLLSEGEALQGSSVQDPEMPVPLNLWDHGKKSMQKQGLRVEQQEEVTPEQWSVLWETTLGWRKVMSHKAETCL